MTPREWLVSLVTLTPAPRPRWPIALQAACAMFLPVALFTVLGRQDVGLQAAGGAFTALYLAGAATKERAKALPLVGGAFIVCAAAGAAASTSPVLSVVGLVAVALLSAWASYAFSLGPPGPVFFPLVYGLAAHITSAVVDGRRVVDPWAFLGAFALGCVIAYLVALAPLLARRNRDAAARPLGDILPGPHVGRSARLLVVRVAIVAVAGTAASILWLDQERAYWTVCAGIAVIGVNAGRRTAVVRGSQRLVGTVLGAAVFAVLAIVPMPVWAVPFVLGGLQFAIEILVVRNYALALICITPLVLLLTVSAGAGAGTGVDAGALAAERVLDTLVGAALGAATGLIHRRPKQ